MLTPNIRKGGKTPNTGGKKAVSGGSDDFLSICYRIGCLWRSIGVKVARMETLGRRLKKYRARSGYTAKHVAIRLGVAESTYRAWESDRAIRGEPYLAIAALFEISVTELLTGKGTICPEIDATICEAEKVLARLQRLRAQL